MKTNQCLTELESILININKQQRSQIADCLWRFVVTLEPSYKDEVFRMVPLLIEKSEPSFKPRKSKQTKATKRQSSNVIYLR
jgi:hypothetical protein